jgi:hypothetical protein
MLHVSYNRRIERSYSPGLRFYVQQVKLRNQCVPDQSIPAIQSLQSYVLVSQPEARIEIYNRQGDGWHFSEVIGLDKTLRLESIGCSRSLSEIYEKVTFTQA